MSRVRKLPEPLPNHATSDAGLLVIARRVWAPRAEALRQVLALEELHGDVRRASPHAVVEDLHDMRAAELRGGLGLALEAGPQLGRLRGLFVDELDRARHVEPGVLGEPHGPHSALPQRADQTESIGDDEPCGQLHGVRVSLHARALLVESVSVLAPPLNRGSPSLPPAIKPRAARREWS
jgi:hypothetical protein